MTTTVDPDLDRRFPAVLDIERAASRRMPKFVRDYVACGMGRGGGLQRNRDALDSVRLLPRYLVDADKVDTATTLLGKDYAAPFGVAPVGLGGIAWSRSTETIAAAAREHRIPFAAATFALASLETLRKNAGDYGWFQLYRPNIADIEEDILHRAETVGYDTLIVTVDVPAPMRRDHDIRNGFSLPLQFGLRTAAGIAACPAWAIGMLRSGFPTFETLARYVPDGMSNNQALDFMTDLTANHTTPKMLEKLRARWPGKLIVKGILDADEAVLCRDIGLDAVIVSNHGGRQLEAAPSPVDVLPEIRATVGGTFPLIADGGVRTGTDIARMLAKGADFVLAGRPFYWSVAAMGQRGADHNMRILKSELECVMGQLGCRTVAEIPDRLIERGT
ncbi:MAG: alpha-hydroxy acid oxidase [Hyphomicrobiaceae bacterium]